MRRLLIGLLLALAAGSALAGACDTDQVKEVGTKTEVNTFGEHCLGFELPGDATEDDYNVMALSVPHAVGRTLKPLKEGNPVNTLNLPVKLRSGRVKDVQVNYVNQDVAYLDFKFKVSLEKGYFKRNGQYMMRKSSVDYGNLLWGVLWTTTFGLVSLVWIPNVTETLHYTEAIPLDSPPIHYKIGGWGGCISFSPHSKGFWIVPSQLKPGHVYPMYADIWCDRPFGGIKSAFGLLISVPAVRWVKEGLPASYEFVLSPGLSLYGARTIAPGVRADTYVIGDYSEYLPNIYTGNYHDYLSGDYKKYYVLHSGGNLREEHHPHVPKPLDSFEVDRMWELEEERYVSYYNEDGDEVYGVIPRLKARSDRVTLCMKWDDTIDTIEDICQPGYEVTYNRVSADPSGPVTVKPRWGFPATYVGHSVYHGPDGEKVRKLDVGYSISSKDIIITDTFQCVANCDKVR